MFTALLISLIIQPADNLVPVHELPLPLMWADCEFINWEGFTWYCHKRQPDFFVTNTLWMTEDQCTLSRCFRQDGTNLERWCRVHSLEDNDQQYYPKLALKVPLNYGKRTLEDYQEGISFSKLAVSRCWLVPSDVQIHMPWHLSIQRRSPDYFKQRSVLLYDLITEPEDGGEYYVGVVCYLPGIRCRARSIAGLECQLLERYAAYLEKMNELETVDSEHYLAFRRDFPRASDPWDLHTIRLTEESKKLIVSLYGY